MASSTLLETMLDDPLSLSAVRRLVIVTLAADWYSSSTTVRVRRVSYDFKMKSGSVLCSSPTERTLGPATDLGRSGIQALIAERVTDHDALANRLRS